MPSLCRRRTDSVPRSVAHENPLRELCLLQDSDIDVLLLQGVERRLQPPQLPRPDIE